MLALAGHGPGNHVLCLAFRPDGATLASAGDGGRALLWDLSTGGMQAHATGARRITTCAFTPDSRFLYWDDGPNVVRLDCGTGGRQLLHPDSPDLGTFALSPDGTTLAAFTRGRLARWDGRTLRRLPAWEGEYGFGRPAFSADGRRLAVPQLSAETYRIEGLGFAYADPDPYGYWVAVRDTASGEIVARLRGFGQHTGGLTLTPDGAALGATAGPTLSLHDVATGTPRWTLRPDATHFHGIAIAPDGRTLVAGRSDGTVRLYDVATGAERSRYDFRLGKVWCVAIAPDGLRAAAGGSAGSIVVWDLDA
ncbi:MAG: hypothetical protein U0746_03535 [Gemmataceae bacterium]